MTIATGSRVRPGNPEFTAPFTHIQLALELLVSQETDQEKILYLDVIARNTQRLFYVLTGEMLGCREGRGMMIR